MRVRPCIRFSVVSCLIAASTSGYHVIPFFHASKCDVLLSRCIPLLFSWNSLVRVLGKWNQICCRNSRHASSLIYDQLSTCFFAHMYTSLILTIPNLIYGLSFDVPSHDGMFLRLSYIDIFVLWYLSLKPLIGRWVFGPWGIVVFLSCFDSWCVVGKTRFCFGREMYFGASWMVGWLRRSSFSRSL